MKQEILQRALERIELLATVSDAPEGLVRTFLSPANREAAELVMEWMEGLGMEVCHDVGGTVRGILGGSADAKPLLLGSHLDTVIDAGKYDGALGVIGALAALEVLRDENVVLPFPVHVLGFSDEEGVRFQSTYLGSRGVIGELESWQLEQRDMDGLSLSEVLENEGWLDDAETIFYDESSSDGYVELHIEQGRVLEDADEAACIVSGICGQVRLRVVMAGQADHAGTTPMDLRRDALTGAAECVLALETMAREHSPLVGTVGQIQVHPGASNAIPQVAEFTVDLRHPDDEALEHHLGELRNAFDAIANRRDLDFGWEIVQQNGAVDCDPDLTKILLASLESVTGAHGMLPSGAGHDGVILSTVMPIGMIFVRCQGGLSHHPDEYAEPDDIAAGIDILVEFLKRWKP
ncbi:M20 family metallo-hydrolase [Luteolibacter pohnpeiensis]|uniref:M20 family metallo-hydrolase n=1 Tax=Luteolibacter pohnpeiensis TaxID=454153 RepID=A0A934S512_9BACT|nr:M20 family metallo-hydrolase [Luteolibacter pohnpeiensis]MBK1881279.1 M20 family metallo-hydrolase [Luteolibacter pohnpeiensis]